MILNIIQILLIAAIIALLCKSTNKGKLPMEVQLPGGLPIITLTNNNKALNFIIDSGSNVSHICSNYFKDINATLIDTPEEATISGLGSVVSNIKMCEASFEDVMGKTYNVQLSISEELNEVAKSMEESTGVVIHGLLGTDFLKEYKCNINFDSLEVYTK